MNENEEELKLNFRMAKMTSILTSDPAIRKEHRSQIGISDPERRVLEEASSTFGAQPLLANFSPDKLLFFAWNCHFVFSMEQLNLQTHFKQTIPHSSVYKRSYKHALNPHEYHKKSNNSLRKPSLSILISPRISYTSVQQSNE